jgi:membrane protein YdbS with pleckstrin-like domain
MRLATGILVFFMMIPILILWLVLSGENIEMPFWLELAFIVWGVLWIVYLLISPVIRYRRYRYLIDREKIVVQEGLWFITREFAPIERIHQIAVKSGPIDRLYGLANVIATTAGGTVTIRFLEKEKAEEIADALQEKVRQILYQQGISLAALDEKTKNNGKEEPPRGVSR